MSERANKIASTSDSFIHYFSLASCFSLYICFARDLFQFLYLCVYVCVRHSSASMSNAYKALLLNGVKNRGDDHLILT